MNIKAGLFMMVMIISSIYSASVLGDPADEMVDETDYDYEDYEDYEDYDDLTAPDEERGLEGKSTDESVWHPVVAPAHVTLAHQLAYGLKHERPQMANRASARIQWEKGFAGGWFFRADAKASIEGIYQQDKYHEDSALRKARKTYEQQQDVRECYLQHSQQAMSWSVGQQVIVWGKSDGAVVTDVMSPRDLTESVFTTIEDARLGQTMVVMNYYGAWFHSDTSQQQWTLVVNPDVRVNEYAQFGHPYHIPVSAGEDAVIVDNTPVFFLADSEIGLRWLYSAGKWDVSVMMANVVEDAPVFTLRGLTPEFQPVLETTYGRYSVLGGGVNIGVGNFVFKGEVAYKARRQVNTGVAMDITRRNMWDGAIGFDYDAAGVFDAGVELSHQFVQHWNDSIVGLERNSTTIYGTLGRHFMNDTLRIQYTGSVQMQEMQSLHRLEAAYDVDDQWALALQWDHFSTRSGDTGTSGLSQLEALDRLSLMTTYDF